MSAPPMQRRSRSYEKAFVGVCLFAVFAPLALLVVLIAQTVSAALPKFSFDAVSDDPALALGFGVVTLILSAITFRASKSIVKTASVIIFACIVAGLWSFLTGYSETDPEIAGVLPALVGSVLLVLWTTLFALPVGVAAAVYLEEYASESRFAGFIEVIIANLAGVPSIVYGLLGLGLFVRTIGMGDSLLAGAATLALLILPVLIVSAREALRNIPKELRDGSRALGATTWQTTRQVVLPMATPGILTGAILSLSRAIGETAPLLMVGATGVITFLSFNPNDSYTALPIQVYAWVSHPRAAEFAPAAAAAIIVLIVTMLVLNTAAIVLRNRLQRRA